MSHLMPSLSNGSTFEINAECLKMVQLLRKIIIEELITELEADDGPWVNQPFNGDEPQVVAWLKWKLETN